MEYQALYRKYRPSQFAQVVGQRHITDTLQHEVVDGKTAHAYLFAGPRGTGKTTTARLLAKALNCANRGADGEPDSTCDSCIAIASGSSLDVIELDAASHNKVEDIREIRMNVSTVAVSGAARRVYILDEAHMLSRAAGNALLKTLEEPPAHVVFVLATTEPYKLLDTIRSRSQRFDFLPVASEALVTHLFDISGRESFEVNEAALSLIATHAGGSVRDSMSLLEQVAVLGGGKVESEAVARALGLADPDAFGRLADAVHAHDAAAGLTLLAELSARGADLRRFISDALGYFRGVFLAQYSPNLEEVVDESGDVIAEWRVRANEMTAPETLRIVDELGEALVQLRQGREERLVVELAMLRLTRPETSEKVSSLRDRIDRLEQQVRALMNGGPPALSVAERPTVEPATPAVVDDPEAPFAEVTRPQQESASPSKPDADPADLPVTAPDPSPVIDQEPAPTGVAISAPVAVIEIGAIRTAWPAIVAGIRDLAGPRRHALIKEAAPDRVEGGELKLTVPDHLPFHQEQMAADGELRSALESLIATHVNVTMTVAFGSGGGGGGGVPDPLDAAVDSPDAGATAAAVEADLVDESDGPDPADLVIDLLGGEVVSD